MSGLLNDSLDLVVGILEDAGIPVVDDIRNLTPPAVIVDPPSITAISSSLISLEFPISCVAPQPGNRDATKKTLELADAIYELESEGLIPVAGRYGVYGERQLPSYQITVRLTVRRT
jgi:hypothetical protein